MNGRNTLYVSAANLRYIDCYAEKRVVDYIIVSKAKKHSLAHTMVNEELSILYMGTALLFLLLLLLSENTLCLTLQKQIVTG